MCRAASFFASLILLQLLGLPLCAETSLEQLRGMGLGAQFSIPMPVIGRVNKRHGSVEEALKKLPLFNYRNTDVLSVARSTPLIYMGYSREEVELVISDPLGQIGEFKQRCRYYRTSLPGPRPTVLIFPPFTPQAIDDFSAIEFIRKGYNAIIISPSESLTDTTRPLDKVDDMLIRGVIAARMCIDLLETFPEVDREKIYAYGISMGGIRTSLTFGVEPRVKKAMEIVGGGDLPDIIADTHFKLLKSLRDTRMAIEGLATVEDFRAYMKKVTVVDPLDFAVLRNPEDIFMVLGHGDRFVPYIYQYRLYAAFSRPAEGRYPRVQHSIIGHWPTALKCAKYIEMFTEFVER